MVLCVLPLPSRRARRCICIGGTVRPGRRSWAPVRSADASQRCRTVSRPAPTITARATIFTRVARETQSTSPLSNPPTTPRGSILCGTSWNRPTPVEPVRQGTSSRHSRPRRTRLVSFLASPPSSTLPLVVPGTGSGGLPSRVGTFRGLQFTPQGRMRSSSCAAPTPDAT